MNLNKLRGAVYEKFPSSSACAVNIGWTKQKLSNILNGLQIPNVYDIKLIAESCELSNEKLLDIFLPERSQKA